MSAQVREGADIKPLRAVDAALRAAANTAAARCRCYAAFSELTASPHDVDVLPSIRGRLGVATGLPFPAAFDALLEEFAATDPALLKSEYSGLFEVGSKGPPAPIREDLHTGQKAGTREDIVRFYDYFGYRLEERFAWAPDHLSVELEFMHFLCFHEGGESLDPLSWQLAQADFSERHLANWVPGVAGAVAKLAPESIYGRLLRALRDFVVRDYAWQASTIVTKGEGTHHG